MTYKCPSCPLSKMTIVLSKTLCSHPQERRGVFGFQGFLGQSYGDLMEEPPRGLLVEPGVREEGTSGLRVAEDPSGKAELPDP